MTSIIKTEQLTKSYGSRRGIVDVGLDVAEGEAFGFLGPNGAGKTTTIRTLLDLIRPSSGRAFVFGIESTDSSSTRRAASGSTRKATSRRSG
jgi:beta-exotoxin I transport system ATP-binding protein